MRVYDNGSYFTVSYNRDDAAEFSARWPTSTVRGKGYFEYDKRNGDLVGAGGSAERGDGPDWLAFSEDLQWYGERVLGIETGHALNPDEWIVARKPRKRRPRAA